MNKTLDQTLDQINTLPGRYALSMDSGDGVIMNIDTDDLKALTGEK